jgi:hypothetical protein
LHCAAEAIDGGVMQGDSLGGEHRLDWGSRLEGFQQGGSGLLILLLAAGEGAGQPGEQGLPDGRGEGGVRHDGLSGAVMNVSV